MFFKKNINIIIQLLIIFLCIVYFHTYNNSYYYQDKNPTVITAKENWTNFNEYKNVKLLSGQKVKGEFKAFANRLGTIEVKFETFDKINSESLIFRIKEKGQTDWYYQNKYKTDQFNKEIFFPFGFPVIENSQNKSYEIEIESIQGNIDDSIAINSTDSFFLSKYSFPKSYLEINRSKITYFAFKKIISFFLLIDLKTYLSTLLFSLILLIIFNFFLNLFSDRKTNIHPVVTLKKSKDNNKIKILPFQLDTVSNIQKIFFLFINILTVFIISTFLIFLLNEQTEILEWQIYVYSSILIFTFLYIVNFFNDKLHLSTNFYYKILKINLIFYILVTFIAFNQKIINQNYLLFFILCFIPIIDSITYSSTKNLITLKGISFLKGLKLIEVLLINLISIIVISAYFTIYSYNLNLQTILKITLLSTLIYISLIKYFQSKPKNKLFSWFSSSKILIIFTPIIWYLSQKEIDTFHCSFYIGPIFDVIKGKSILFDTPSQYGYLSIHFLATMLNKVGVSFNSFHLTNTLSFAISCFIACMVLFKLLNNRILAILCSLIYISFQTVFSHWNGALYPSTGPLRFGFALLIVWSLTFLPKKISFILSSILASISLFWSVETAIYTFPAWLFTCLIISHNETDSLKTFLKSAIKKILFFIFISVIIFCLIAIKEKITTQNSSGLLNYFEYASIYQKDFGSLPIQPYGNHYLLIVILLLGLVTTIHFIFKKDRSALLPLMAFVSIHNVAIFSYFISRSHENNIINISGFFIIEIVIIYKIVTDFYKFKTNSLIKYLLMPVIFFILLYSFRIGNKLKTEKSKMQHNFKTNQKLWQDLSIRNPELFNLLKENNIENNPVILLKDYEDTELLTESNIKNEIALNPAIMTNILTNWQPKYISPVIKNLKTGTVIVVATNIKESFLFPIFNEINQIYELKYLTERNKLDFYQVLKSKNVDQDKL